MRLPLRWSTNVAVGCLFVMTGMFGRLAAQTPEPTSPAQAGATVTGIVRDSQGTGIPGLEVLLTSPELAESRRERTNGDSTYTFSGLPPGQYRVKIESQGLEPFASDEFSLSAGERREVPLEVEVQIPDKVTTVEVKATLNQVAQAQVKEQEQQRLLGFLPNFYTSYIWNAAPMSRKLKFKLAFKTTADPVNFAVVGLVAGVEQARNSFPGYGLGAEGYAKRYGATYADRISGRMFGSAIFPSLFHQDPRYFYQGSGSVRSRLRHALLSTLICRTDSGKAQFFYSHVLGSFAAAGLSNAYRAPEDRTAGRTMRNGLIILSGSAVVYLFDEFVSKHVTPNVPHFAQGKPKRLVSEVDSK